MTPRGMVKTPARSRDSLAVVVSARLALTTTAALNKRSHLSVLAGVKGLAIRTAAMPGQTAMNRSVTTTRSTENGGRVVAARAIQPEAASGRV